MIICDEGTYREATAEDIKKMAYRDMTVEEIDELEKMHAEPTAEERLDKVEQRTDTLESATDDIVLMLADIIGGE